MSGYKALQDVRILSLTQFFLGPSAVQYLADMGAEVTKIEPVQGAYERRWSGANQFIEGRSMFYMLANRRAKSVSLNLKDGQAQSIALSLAHHVDVVVQNFRPGVAERLGLGYDAVRAVNPGVIYASASGYGESGEYRDLPGQDLLLQAMTGLASISGTAEGPPTPTGCAVIDQHGAALLAMGILGALYRRSRSGEGEHVHVTMAMASLDLQLESISYHLNGGAVRRSADGLASGYHPAPYGIYPTADGYLAVSLSPISTIAEALGSDALRRFSEADGWTRRQEIAELMAAALKRRAAKEWEGFLRGHGVWVQRVNTYDDVLSDPAMRSLEPFESVNVAGVGEVRFLRSAIEFEGARPVDDRAPVGLGANTWEVLSALGYGSDDIARLAEEGIIGGAAPG